MQPRRILIVDADVGAAATLRERVAALGCDVVAVARSAREAIGMPAGDEPDLVLVRVPPGGAATGLQAAGVLQRHRPVPVVLVAGEADEQGLQPAGPAQPPAYVVEPFSDRELRVNIELALCRHDAARVAREMEDRFFELSVDMLCFLDFNGYFKRLNPAWERTLGFSREELMSRPFIEFVHPADRERTLNQNREVRGGGKALAFENRYVCRDGSFRWFLWNAASDAAAQTIYSVARDITAAKRAELEREQLVRQLQAALAEVKALRLILPTCSYCRKIRDDDNRWHNVETYISRHTNTRFSHGICPECMASEVEPQMGG